MKVVNIHEEGRYAGPSKQAMDLAQAIGNLDVEMIILFPEQDSDVFCKKLDSAKVRYETISLRRLSKKPLSLLLYVLTFFGDIRRIKKKLHSLDVDIVQCNGSWQIKGVLASYSLGIPIVWHLTDTLMPNFIKFLFNTVRKGRVRYFISASERGLIYYLNNEIVGQKTWVIQSPVNTVDYRPMNIENNVFWSIDRKVFRVVTVGNITPVKGYERLLNIAEEIKKRSIHDIQFVIIGRVWDSQKIYYKKLLDLIRLTGLNNVKIVAGSDDVNVWLAGADIYFCSSNSESSPIAMWEAMACALPIVSTNVGDVYRIVQENQAGLVREHDDIVGLVDAIMTLKNDSALRSKMSSNAREVALEILDTVVIAEQHKKVYAEILHDQSG